MPGAGSVRVASVIRKGAGRLMATVAVAAMLGMAAVSSGEAQGGVTANLEVRVWQNVRDDLDISISARPEGGSWRTLGTVGLPLDDGVSDTGYREVAIAGPPHDGRAFQIVRANDPELTLGAHAHARDRIELGNCHPRLGAPGGDAHDLALAGPSPEENQQVAIALVFQQLGSLAECVRRRDRAIGRDLADGPVAVAGKEDVAVGIDNDPFRGAELGLIGGPVEIARTVVAREGSKSPARRDAPHAIAVVPDEEGVVFGEGQVNGDEPQVAGVLPHRHALNARGRRVLSEGDRARWEARLGGRDRANDGAVLVEHDERTVGHDVERLRPVERSRPRRSVGRPCSSRSGDPPQLAVSGKRDDLVAPRVRQEDGPVPRYRNAVGIGQQPAKARRLAVEQCRHRAPHIDLADRCELGALPVVDVDHVDVPGIVDVEVVEVGELGPLPRTIDLAPPPSARDHRERAARREAQDSMLLQDVQVPRAVQRDPARLVEFRLQCGTDDDPFSPARNRGDGAVGRDLADQLVAPIGDVDVPLPIDIDIAQGLELRHRGRPIPVAVAVAARERGHDAIGREFANGVVPVVHNDDPAVRVGRQRDMPSSPGPAGEEHGRTATIPVPPEALAPDECRDLPLGNRNLKGDVRIAKAARDAELVHRQTDSAERAPQASGVPGADVDQSRVPDVLPDADLNCGCRTPCPERHVQRDVTVA